MKKMMYMVTGIMVGMMLSECKQIRKPFKNVLKKINIE